MPPKTIALSANNYNFACVLDRFCSNIDVSINFFPDQTLLCTYRTYYIHTGPSKMINNEELFPKKSNCCWRRNVCAAATK